MNIIQCRDEILQMMYWMRGERIAERVTLDDLDRFLRIDAASLRAALDQLLESGLVAAADERYALTERGIAEAGRRFFDEFSNVLGKEDHVSCDDPDCECHMPDFEGRCRSLP